MSEQPAGSVLLAEATLVGRAQDGDVDSFEILVRRYQAPIVRLAYRMVLDRGEAEDIAQDTFVLVWRQLPTLTDPAAFKGWVFQIATRGCLSLLRVRARRNTATVPAEDLQTAQDRQPAGNELSTQPSPDPETAAQDAQQRHGLDDALGRLPMDQRACWVLHEIHALSYPEIAAATCIPVSTVRGRIARARQNLQKDMSPWR